MLELTKFSINFVYFRQDFQNLTEFLYSYFRLVMYFILCLFEFCTTHDIGMLSLKIQNKNETAVGTEVF